MNLEGLLCQLIWFLRKFDGNRLATELQNGDYGTLGISIYATAEAARLTAVINQADTYKALKAEFTAQKAKEQLRWIRKKQNWLQM